VPKPLSSVPGMTFLSLMSQAQAGEVVLYVGAGVSVGSGLPGGARLSELVYEKVAAAGGVNLDGVSPTDLLAVADAAELANGGDPRVVQEISLAVADFDHAQPSAPHEALALLLVEGAAAVMSTNWDTCIERAAPQGESIASIVTNDDRMGFRGVGLLKLHGCARRPSTALVTSRQLAETPIWASTEMEAKLSHASVVFVGIGDVAPYVAVRLQKLVELLGSVQNISVVSRSIVSRWDESQWSSVVEDLAESHKIESSAEEFLDDFLRAWVLHCFDRLTAISTGLADAALMTALHSLLDTLRSASAPQVLGWLRRSSRGVPAGTSVAHHSRIHEALLALAALTGSESIAQVPYAGPAHSTKGKVDLHIQPGVSGPEAARAARARVQTYRSDGVLAPDEPVIVLCSGQIGPLAPSTHEQLEQDVAGADEVGNVLSGPAVGPVKLLAAHSVLEGNMA